VKANETKSTIEPRRILKGIKKDLEKKQKREREM